MNLPPAIRRRPAGAAAAAAALLVLVVGVVLLLGRTAPPADRADTFVPSDALFYVHLSTDPDREEDAELLDRLEDFRAFGALRTRVQDAVGRGTTGAFDFKRDVRSWLGDEAAVAATPMGTMAVLEVAREATAQGVLTRVAGARAAERRGGIIVRRFGTSAAAFVGGFLVVGPKALVDRSIDVHAGRVLSLARLETYARVAELRPDDRALDAWSAGPLPALAIPSQLARVVGGKPASVSLVPTDAGLRVEARRLGGASRGADFEPELLDAIPRDALAYVGLRGLRALGALLPPAAGEAAPQLESALGPLLDVLDGEVAVSIAPATGEPVVTLAARTRDPARAREALAGMQGVIASVLTGSGKSTGQVPTFDERDLGDGLQGYGLRLAGGGELVYAVSGRTVIISNADDGVRRAARPESGLEDAETFGAAVDGVPGTAQALGFFATSQLLELADEAGLDASPVYRAARPDLARISALGAVVRRQGNDTTVELNLLIP